jgi:hypothetical protein
MFLCSQCRIIYFHVSYVRAYARNIQSYCNIVCLILRNLCCLTNCSHIEFVYEMDSVVLRSIIATYFLWFLSIKTSNFLRNVEISFYLPVSQKGASRFCSKSDDTGYSFGSNIWKSFAEHGLSDVIAILKLDDQISEEHTRFPVIRRTVQCNHYVLDIIGRRECFRDLPQL